MKKHWVTNLRVMATLTVVLLHAAGYGSLHVKKIPLTDWWICHIINVFGRFAVPVFVMLSGYLLIVKYEELSSFIKKRFSRIFVPFLIWSLLYMIWSNFKGVPSERTPWALGDFISKILAGNGGGSGHLWFVYMLLGIYAITPVISRWIKGTETSANPLTKRTEILYFLVLWFTGNVVYTLLNKWFGIEIKFELRYFSGFIGYFVLGYWLGNSGTILPKSLLILSFLASWVLTAYICYDVSWQAGIYVYDYTDYLSVPVMLMSVLMFLLFKQHYDKPFAPGIMAELDMSSYGMYLVHALILRILSRQFHINFTWIHPLVGIAVHFLLGAVISYLIVKIISKIPKAGSWIVG
ncbi:acyltransferase [Emticicia sp. 21SJ11W-3]|uniref:acyltransferase n=1 Tax=Emticicia sp. 21SJ11W-3 TaxID=2916755 RepID=UPI00209F50ED|nr:acyltransferase family protein [Emticicia sp. 21SJ11W-3]UTA69830.1 acyltransferase family protein [Emticicia sp. 21SJ11W-3]